MYMYIVTVLSKLSYRNKLTLLGKVNLLSEGVADSVLIFCLKIGHHCRYINYRTRVEVLEHII